MLSNATDDEMRDAVAAVRFHDDKVGGYVFCRLDYRGGDFGVPREMPSEKVTILISNGLRARRAFPVLSKAGIRIRMKTPASLTARVQDRWSELDSNSRIWTQPRAQGGCF